jgi:N-acetylglucosamine-6-sulfatase
VRAALERGGLAGSTVLVFLGDNGFMMGEKGIGGFGASGKVVPYESSIRVPMVVRAPEIQAFSGPSQLLVSALDLPPTIAGLAGIEAPPSWPGRNLLPALRSRETPGFEDAFSEWADDRNESYGHLAHRLVRTRDHKLIVWQDPARPNELYELARDPREEENLSGRPEVAEVEADLMRRLRAWLERTADPARGWPKLAGIGHEAEDTRLERRVAVKLIHPEVASKPGSIERCRREARALASLDPAQVERILGEAMRK